MADSALFKPLRLGNLTLSHRLVMAPLTRFRATDEHVPNPMVATYYAQRGCVPGTLLVSEATVISPQGGGYANVPGIWTSAQIEGWKAVTRKVHEQGSFIFCQLWALGRVASPKVLLNESGLDVVGASALPVPKSPGSKKDPVTPRPLTTPEIWQIIGDYAQAARNAIDAGFDGVEIHGANGYLVDQFIQDVTNNRTDEWGGSIEKRTRFALEVAKACVDAIGKERVGIRQSPYSTFQGMKMDDPRPTFSHLARAFGELGLAYIHVTESRVASGGDNQDVAAAAEKINFVVDAWRSVPDNTRPVLIAGGYNASNSRQAVDEEYRGQNVGVVIGRLWISNPDLAFRIREGLELTRYNRKTFYLVQKEEGYTDYPFSKEFGASRANL